MGNIILITAFFLTLMSSPKSYAGELFVLTNNNLNNTQKMAVALYFKKTSDLMPELMKESLKKTIEISFENFEESAELTSLPADKCHKSVNLIYGKTNRLNGHISLNALLLQEIVKGENNAQSFDCGHKNYYRLAMATLLHETAHLYDHLKFGSTLISGQKAFFKLSDWKRNMLFRSSSKNTSQKRSIDPYEYKNLEEHFAVNFEYFILDAEYKCKRPSYYRFFQDQLNTSPNESFNCKINSLVRLDDTKALIDIAPERVYRVDYLLASKGDEMMSGFGHSMYRLVVCAPFRKTVSADCLKDKLYHVVLSFRANVTDIKSNPLKGLAGKYDSILFMLSFPKVIEEYNMAELRDLYSVPLHFTSEQKERFINKTLETYWEYTGSYKFFTSNCASESNELLQAALNNDPIINESVVKPYSLLEVLIDHKLTDADPISNLAEAKKNGILFESDAKQLEDIKLRLFGASESDYALTKQMVSSPKGPDKIIVKKTKKHIKDIIESMSTEQFENVLATLESEEPNLKTKNLFNDLSIFTQAAVNVRQHNLDEKIGDYLESVEKDPGLIGQSVRNWNLKRKNFRLSPLKEDYGIPLEITEQDFDTYKNETELLEKTEMDLVNNVKDLYKSEVDNLMAFQKIIGKARNISKIIGMNLYLSR